MDGQRRSLLLSLLLWGVLFIGSPLAYAQVRVIHPLSVVDIREMTPSVAGTACNKITDISQSGSRWAALVECPDQKSVVVWGDGKSTHPVVLDGRFDRIVMDSAHNMVVRSVPLPVRSAAVPASKASIVFTKAQVLDANGNVSRTMIMKSAGARPLMTGDAVRWATQFGAFTDSELTANAPSRLSRYADTNQNTPQIVYVLGLPMGGHVTIGNLTETVNVFDEHNSPAGSHVLHLDDAYRSIGAAIRPPDVQSGRTRILWAAGSANGLVYICLSDTPMSGPAYIAVVDPLSGGVNEVFRAELPSASGRIERRFNPTGVICPTLGAVNGHLVIADPDMQVVAFY